MIDTLGVIIPLPDRLFNHLRGVSVCTSRVDRTDGEVLFEYDNFDLPIPSSNYKVKMRLDDRKYIYDPDNKTSVLESGFPFLRFEFSAPKVLYKHNLVSIGVESALDACLIVKEAFDKKFVCALPSMRAWFLNRLDVCANFILQGETEVKNYMSHLQRMEYPRRVQNLYKDNGMYFASRHNTLKIYAKGDEFRRHDLKRFVNEIEGQRLYNEARKILRVECELKGRLKYIHEKHLEGLSSSERLEYSTWSGYPLLYDFIEYANIAGELTRMIETFMIGKETKSMESLKVLELLKASYSERQAHSFHHVYTVIVTQGMTEAKRQFNERKVQRARTAFRDLGISFVSDIQKIDNLDTLFPSDFSLQISEKNKYYQLPVAV